MFFTTRSNAATTTTALLFLLVAWFMTAGSADDGLLAVGAVATPANETDASSTSSTSSITLVLTDVSSKSAIVELHNGSVLDVNELPSKLTVEAAVALGTNDASAAVSDVEFSWSSNDRGSFSNTESIAPYMLAGEKLNGAYRKFEGLLIPGTHTLSATATLVSDGAIAVTSISRTVEFSVIDSSISPPAPSTPSAAPSRNPTAVPSSPPAVSPSSKAPSSAPSAAPSTKPSLRPSTAPPATVPTSNPSTTPSLRPSTTTTMTTNIPSGPATVSKTPTRMPQASKESATPTMDQSVAPTVQAETTTPSATPTRNPIVPPVLVDAGGSDPIFIEENGLLVVEAESIILTSSDDGSLWSHETDLDGFYGDSFVRFTGNTPSNGKPKGRRSLYFLVTNPGQYQLAIRSLKNDTVHTDYSNDCYTRLLGGDGYQGVWTKTYNGFKPSVWSWSTTHYPAKRFDVEPVSPVYNLVEAPAVYELQFAGRSQHYRMDRIVLYNADFVTRGYAKHHTREESARLTEMPSGSPTAAPTPAPTAGEPSMPPSALPSASPTTDPPTGAPSFSSAPTISAAPTNPPTFVTYYFVDAGSATEDTSLWRANKGDRTMYLPSIDIVQPYQPFADAEVFRSHRWSAKMTYTFPRLQPGRLYNLTLGFAEIYHCDSDGNGTVGNRIFDVLVNGQTLLARMDVLVHAAGRCNTAHYEHETVPASQDDGSITLKFFSTVDRAMVSLIVISML